MTKVEHTPGPWSFKVAANGDCGIFAEKTGIFIEAFADIRHSGEDNQLEARANAHLIAAAPELLKQLKIVTDTLAYLKGDDWDTIKNARAVIAKAKGET